MRKPLLLFSAASLVLAPSAVPAQYPARTLDPRLVAEAQREHSQLLAEYGGADSSHRATYVESVGRRVAAPSGIANPQSAFRFTLLNSAVENAFAQPGGYIYLTRQLVTLMDNEAELAFALAHEVGHVADGHAQERERAQSNAVWRQLPWILFGGLIGGNLGNAIASRGLLSAKLQTLSFSRDQEYRADLLGMRLMSAAGYDPAGAAGILDGLTRYTALQRRVQGRDNRQLPEWASTHPLSENRMREALSIARSSGRLGTGTLNRDAFLDHVDGMFVDDDPEQGVIDGRSFSHPDLRIHFAVPVGYLMQNGTRAVSISGSAGKAQFGGGRYGGTLENYVAAVFRELGGNRRIAVPPPRRTVVNGIPAAYSVSRARTSSGMVDVSVVAYQWGPQTVYHFVMLTSAGAGIGPFLPMVNSIRKLSAEEAGAIRPRVIDVVTVASGDTVQSLSSRMAYRDFRVERFLALNKLSATAPLIPGQKVKLVVYGARRG